MLGRRVDSGGISVLSGTWVSMVPYLSETDRMGGRGANGAASFLASVRRREVRQEHHADRRVRGKMDERAARS